MRQKLTIILLLFVTIACTGSDEVIYTNSTVSGYFSGEVKVYEENPPSPENFEVVGIVTLEHPSKESRYENARNVAKNSGGDGIIPKQSKSVSYERVTHSVDPSAPGGFGQTLKIERTIRQEFLIIRLKSESERKKDQFITEEPKLFNPEAVVEPPPQPQPKPAPQIAEQPLTQQPVEPEKPESRPKHPGSRKRYIDNNSGIIIDKVSRKAWQKCNGGEEFQDNYCSGSPLFGELEKASVYCQNLKLEGKSWRLPSISELRQSVQKEETESGNVAIEPLREYVNADIYWSTTMYEGSEDVAWVIDFSSGATFQYGVNNPAFVRCISSN